MIPLGDPSRLFESEDTPQELREWLTDARKHKPSAVQVQGLVQAVSSLQGLEPGLQPLAPPPASETYAAGAGKALVATKLVATLAIGLATASVGIYCWDGPLSPRSGSPLFGQAPASGSNLDSREHAETATRPIEEPSPRPIEERAPNESAAEGRTWPATSPLVPTHS